MQKKLLIGISVMVACVTVFASYTNVVGVQTVKSSSNRLIKDEVHQKELLFQTIIDIANNREIQKIIFNSEMREGMFFNPGKRFPVFIPHVLTKRFLNAAYHLGLILSKTLSKSKIHSMLVRYQVGNQGMQKEIATVIEKDATLKGEMTQLSNLKCDCEETNTTVWHFPILCTLLFPLFLFIDYLNIILPTTFILAFIYFIIRTYGEVYHCFWYH